MKIFIIIFIISSYSGDDIIMNPPEQKIVCYDKTCVAREIDKINKDSYSSNIKIYSGEVSLINYEVNYIDEVVKKPIFTVKDEPTHSE